VRNTAFGSARMARNAGTTLATSATVISSTPTAANTAGSFAGC
jgi:hypothetical protein